MERMKSRGAPGSYNPEQKNDWLTEYFPALNALTLLALFSLRCSRKRIGAELVPGWGRAREHLGLEQVAILLPGNFGGDFLGLLRR